MPLPRAAAAAWDVGSSIDEYHEYISAFGIGGVTVPRLEPKGPHADHETMTLTIVPMVSVRLGVDEG